MDVLRLARHLSMTSRHLRRAFPTASLRAVEQAIASSELGHLGTIRFAVESALPLRNLVQGQTPRERAIELFSQLRVWDTVHNNGILIYLLLADRALEIVADRGIHERIDQRQWDAIAERMASAFRRQGFESGVIDAVQSLHLHLATHFPSSEATS